MAGAVGIRRAHLIAGAIAALGLLGAAWPRSTGASPPTDRASESVGARAPKGSAERVDRDAQSRRRRARARRAHGPSPQYRRMMRRWHRRAPRDALRAWQHADPPPLVLRPAGRAERFELTPESDSGGFDVEDLAKMEEACRFRDGSRHAIHPRVVELVYRAVREFRAPYVTVVSGYRPDRATSRHTQGRAVDIVLPGISDRRLARFMFKQGFVGVGIYTRSGFVHVDVRARSYFWIDRSAPGQPQRRRRILPALSERYDREAIRHGVERVPDLSAPAEGAGETEDDG